MSNRQFHLQFFFYEYFLKTMRAEEENSAAPSVCSASEAQALELEFIKMYEQLPILWNTKHPDYSNKYRRQSAIDILLKIMKKWNSSATGVSVRQKINIMRCCYRKALRRRSMSKILGPNGQEIYEYNPKNWKFHALRFLDDVTDIECNENNSSSSIAEINLDNVHFENEEGCTNSGGEDISVQVSDVLQTVSEHKTCVQNTEANKRTGIKPEVQDYVFVDNNPLDKEFEAIGSNVACKLKRMNPNQRFHAELLINKVLIEGLKNNLTDETDLTVAPKLND